LWDTTGLLERFLPWFLRDFWEPILMTIPGIAAQYPWVKFVTIIVVRESLSEQLPSNVYCLKESFDPKKFVELPLHFWSQDDIIQWLYKFGNLMGDPINLSVDQVENLARVIYKISDGVPHLIQDALMERLQKLV
jgi:hypothetical protein